MRFRRRKQDHELPAMWVTATRLDVEYAIGTLMASSDNTDRYVASKLRGAVVLAGFPDPGTAIEAEQAEMCGEQGGDVHTLLAGGQPQFWRRKVMYDAIRQGKTILVLDYKKASSRRRWPDASHNA